jgi:hypothetical protein
MRLVAFTSLFTTILAAGFAVSPVAQITAQTLVTEQRTTIHINVTVEHSQIVAGPYARYSQKFLGVAAPLADKVTHQVKSVKVLDESNIPWYEEVRFNDTPTHMNPAVGFPRLTVDKTSAIAASLEESARAAAATIFEIRKSRIDLITGEVGENVFGGGLESALAELTRLEEEHLSLFLGRQTVRIETRQFRITPAKSRLNYTVCRFSEADGLLSEDDMSGAPMLLELKLVDGSFSTEGFDTQSKPSSKTVPQLIPADVRCRVILDGRELASEVLTISQFGQTVYVAR